jgi:hypothetical protein
MVDPSLVELNRRYERERVDGIFEPLMDFANGRNLRSAAPAHRLRYAFGAC